MARARVDGVDRCTGGMVQPGGPMIHRTTGSRFGTTTNGPDPFVSAYVLRRLKSLTVSPVGSVRQTDPDRTRSASDSTFG